MQFSRIMHEFRTIGIIDNFGVVIMLGCVRDVLIAGLNYSNTLGTS